MNHPRCTLTHECLSYSIAMDQGEINVGCGWGRRKIESEDQFVREICYAPVSAGGGCDHFRRRKRPPAPPKGKSRGERFTVKPFYLVKVPQWAATGRKRPASERRPQTRPETRKGGDR